MKKILCIITALSFILSTLAYAEGASITEAQKSDLHNLGIMVGDEDGNLRLNDTITRAEAIKMICIAGNIPTYDEFKNTFPDVDKNHWAYKFFCAAVKNDIIIGDGNLNPECNITNEEIVKILVRLLGYSEFAEMQGGYPAGYMMAGTRFGITSTLQLAINTPATRNDVGIMICNALDIPIMIQNPYSPDGAVEYIILDGSNQTEKVTLRSKLYDK